MELTVIDLEPYLRWRAAQNYESELPIAGGDATTEFGTESTLKLSCEKVAACLRETGALVIRDPRCSTDDNDRFLDMMERYFEQTAEQKRKQERPDLHYQVGVTPEGVEVPRCAVDKEMQELMLKLPQDARPLMPSGPDRKWRYMWRIGPRPVKTRFKELNAEPVVPEGFPEWVEVMDGWGHKMITAVEVVAEMAAVGFGLPRTAFTSIMKQGPHLLAPTGSDLAKYGDLDDVFAGYHYDLNFLTIHGRSRFPGLFIWLKDGRKVAVKVPEGCLLLQAGKQIFKLRKGGEVCVSDMVRITGFPGSVPSQWSACSATGTEHAAEECSDPIVNKSMGDSFPVVVDQLEWLTGGECAAGMHEVVVSEHTVEAIKASRKAGKSLWRVSSTMFAHIASDAVLQPLGHFSKAAASDLYLPICAGDFVEAELAAINLKRQG